MRGAHRVRRRHGAARTLNAERRRASRPPEQRRAGGACELCDLARTTTWYAAYDEPFRFVVLDCDSCDVPMAVLGAHRRVPTDAERAHMQAVLSRVADAKYPHGWFFDDHMRQIPDHYHLHARPFPWRRD